MPANKGLPAPAQRRGTRRGPLSARSAPTCSSNSLKPPALPSRRVSTVPARTARARGSGGGRLGAQSGRPEIVQLCYGMVPGRQARHGTTFAVPAVLLMGCGQAWGLRPSPPHHPPHRRTWLCSVAHVALATARPVHVATAGACPVIGREQARGALRRRNHLLAVAAIIGSTAASAGGRWRTAIAACQPRAGEAHMGGGRRHTVSAGGEGQRACAWG